MKPASLAPSRTLILPEALDKEVAATLEQSLESCRGSDVVIDASFVQLLGAPCIQVLRAAERTWKEDRRLLTLVNGPVRFLEALHGFTGDLEFS